MIVSIEIAHDSDSPWDIETVKFEGDELTSAISESIIYLQEKQQEELEL